MALRALSARYALRASLVSTAPGEAWRLISTLRALKALARQHFSYSCFASWANVWFARAILGKPLRSARFGIAVGPCAGLSPNGPIAQGKDRGSKSLGPGWNAAALYALEDRGYAHSAADAERHQAVLAARTGEVVKNLDGQDGACGPDGVSQCHCSAYRVHLLLGHLERTLHGDSDGGEGLVRLDDVEVVHREPGLLEGQPGGWDHTRPHNRRVDPGHCGGDQPACHGHTEFLCLTLTAHEHHGSPVVDARGVCGSYRAVFLLEDRLQLLKALHARVRADVLVRGELDGLLLLLDLDGYDLAVEEFLFVSLGGPLMAAHGVGV